MSHTSQAVEQDDHSHDEIHIVPNIVFHRVFGGLIIGTIITFVVTLIDFGLAVNVVVALIVASLKALLVVLFFMHLKYEEKDIIKYAIFPVLLLFVFFGGTFLDAPTRGHDDRFSIDSKKVVHSEAHGEQAHH